jgi:hypothetical protein
VSDAIISGDTAIRKAPPPTTVVELQPPAAPPEQLPDRGEGADIRLKHVSDPIEMGELKKEVRRQEQEPPIVQWDAGNVMPEPGPSESFAKQIRRATEALPKARMAALEKEFAALPREEQARQLAEFTIRGGEKKALVVADDGQPVAPLRDGEPIRELDTFRSKEELRRGFSQFRDLQDKAIEAETQRLLAEDDAAQAKIEAATRAVQQPPSLHRSPPLSRSGRS